MKITKKIALLFMLNYCVVILSQQIKSEFQNELGYKTPNLNLSGNAKTDVNQNARVVFTTLCTESVIPPVVLNGVNVTSTFSGDVYIYPDSYSSCTAGYTTPSNSIWLGQTGSFVYTFNFSQPVNNLVIVITGTGQPSNEIFNFTTSSGNPLIIDNGSCFSSIVGNTIYSGAGSDYLTGGGGGVFTITATTPFTSMTISGPGNENGSLFALCSQSVSPVLCNVDTLTPILSSNSLTSICPNTTINLNDISALNTPTNSGVSLAWFTSSVPSVNNQLTNNQIINAIAGVTYYSAFFDATNNCYSISTPLTTTLGQTITPLFDQVSPICLGSTFSLPLVSNNGILGTWFPSNNYNTTTTYTFTPNNSSCANSTTMTVEVNQKTDPIFSIETTLCYGSLSILPSISNNGINGTWTPEWNSLTSTTYSFIPNSGECANTKTLTVSILNDFNFEIFNSCIDGNYFLISNPINDSFSESTSIYDWQYNAISIGNATTLDVTYYIESNAIVYNLPITFILKITNENGCFKSKEFIIDNLYCDIQKGISPNSDGFNEFFDLRLLNVKKLSIYNRFGVNVYNKENYFNEWNGQTNDNKILPDGVYYYLIEYKNNSGIKTGWIYINR